LEATSKENVDSIGVIASSAVCITMQNIFFYIRTNNKGNIVDAFVLKYILSPKEVVTQFIDSYHW
jgi:hypothetical protein